MRIYSDHGLDVELPDKAYICLLEHVIMALAEEQELMQLYCEEIQTQQAKDRQRQMSDDLPFD